ncbi:MAG TPA: isochorismate synthase [Acidimicrobiales bacterium]|nr:isochorismate synthase [Acidimicrobiales bacterium]
MARTRRLDADVDLLDVAGPAGLLFEQAGTGIAGRGTALRIELPVGHDRLRRSAGVVDTALAAVEVDDEIGRPGTGPVAFVALPFGDDDAGGVAVVPSLLVGRDADGTRWVTTVEDADGGATNHPTLVADLTATDPTVPAGMGPGSFEVRASRTPAAWCEAVAEAVATLRRGELGKVVLARQVVVEADAPLDVLGLLRRMRTSYPSAMVFAIDGFVGASPELLVSRTGDIVRSHPMAGTVPRTGDPEADGRLAAELLASSKDRAEHQVTIDVVLDTVLPFCSYVDSEPEPRVVSLANVAHLASLVEGRLSSPPATALTLAAALHPTPAVCGWPRDDARREIARLEGEPRGRYTGAVGWTDARGDGRLAVAIRCAEVDGARATVYAGNGIVAGSDPATELAETRAKLQAVLGSLVQP